MAICVVAIHAYIVGYSGPVLEYVVRLAVPTFMIATGFLVGKRLLDNKDPEFRAKLCKRNMLKLWKLYAVWLAIYFPISIFAHIQDGKDPLHATFLSLGQTIVAMVPKMAWPLWYLPAMAVTFLLAWLSFRKGHGIKLVIIAGILIYLVGIAYSFTVGRGILPFDALWVKYCGDQIGWFIGFGGFTVGLFLAWLSNTRLHFAPVALALMTFSIFLYVVWDTPHQLWGLFGGAAIVLTAVNVQLPDHPVFLLLRNLSILIYFLHMIPIAFTILVMKDDHPEPKWLWLIGVMGALVLGVLLKWHLRLHPGSPLRHLC